jgi:aminopeptidase YwaD
MNEPMLSNLTTKVQHFLYQLCVAIPSRRVGSAGNRAATDLFATTASGFGFATDMPAFDCMDWTADGARLTVAGASYPVQPSPYSLGCHVSAPLAVVSTLAELEEAAVSGAVLLLRGDIAREQLMPKNFPFYNPESHQRIIQLLERKQPAAIISATARDTDMAGALYPFPLIEDGDFHIPSVYATEEVGARLAARAEQVAVLESRAQRVPSTGCNVVARKGAEQAPRIVLFAHIDAKPGTPGALDNASGVVVLLLLAELLAAYAGDLRIELVALNGEDYYANPGEQLYLAQNRFDDIPLGINIDGVGYHRGRVAYSLYNCPPDMTDTIRETFAGREHLAEGEAWYQGDHVLFLLNERPALALTSELMQEVMAEVIHTPRDTLEILDARKLAATAVALRDLLLRLADELPPRA